MSDLQLPLITAPLRTMIPIIKVVGDACNLRCPYCFYSHLDQSTIKVMPPELQEKFISEFMALFSGYITFNWHGGEPLLAGLPFFQRAMELQAANMRDGRAPRNTIQTNGTLIDHAWAEFFKEHKFGVGISFDGCPQAHDMFRVNVAGRKSSDQVMRGIKILREHGLEPGIIQTVTHSTVPYADDSFAYLVNQLGLKHFGVNIFTDPIGINEPMRGEHVSNDELIAFYKRYIDLWLEQDDPQLRIREIEGFIHGIVGKKATSCTYTGTCTAFFSVEPDGRIMPCDRLSNRSELVFGNLNEESLLDILNGNARLHFAETVNRVHPDCVKCELYNVCHNGCTMHRVGGLDGKYYYCEARKTLFAHMQEKIEALQAKSVLP